MEENKTTKPRLKGVIFWTILWGIYLSGIFISWFSYSFYPSFYGFGKFFYGRICHQEKERCFSINDVSLPVCGRCLGIYTSFFLAGLFVLFGGYRFLKVFKKRKIRLITAFLLFLPASLDFLTGGLSIGFVSQTSAGNPARFFLGFLLGLSLCVLLLPSLLFDD